MRFRTRSTYFISSLEFFKKAVDGNAVITILMITVMYRRECIIITCTAVSMVRGHYVRGTKGSACHARSYNIMSPGLYNRHTHVLQYSQYIGIYRRTGYCTESFVGKLSTVRLTPYRRPVHAGVRGELEHV